MNPSDFLIEVDRTYSKKGLMKTVRKFKYLRNVKYQIINGELGKGFMDCHHTLPISNYIENIKTRINDLVLV